MQKASTTTRFGFGRRCEIVGEPGRANFRRGRRIPQGRRLTVRREKL
jgi:hypothetical protein